MASGGFRGGFEPALPPPLGDGLTPSLTVMFANARFCHKWVPDSFRVHQIRFRPGVRPVPHWGSLQRSLDPLPGLRGPTSKGDGRKKRGGKEKRRTKEREGPAPFRKFLDPLLMAMLKISLLRPTGEKHLINQLNPVRRSQIIK